jgi:hypothetical protein
MKRSQISYLLHLPSNIFPKTACLFYIQQNSVLQARLHRLLFIGLVSSLLSWNHLAFCHIHKSRIKNTSALFVTLQRAYLTYVVLWRNLIKTNRFKIFLIKTVSTEHRSPVIRAVGRVSLLINVFFNV